MNLTTNNVTMTPKQVQDLGKYIGKNETPKEGQVGVMPQINKTVDTGIQKNILKEIKNPSPWLF